MDVQLDHLPAALASETVKLSIKVTSHETKAFKLSYEIEAIKAKSRWSLNAVTTVGTDLFSTSRISWTVGRDL
jgi:hypothetical protein